MQWDRKDRYYSESNAGYRISASKSSDGWVFTAWAPCKSRNPYTDKAWEAIGYFNNNTGDNQVKGSAQAVAACEKHFADNEVRHGGSDDSRAVESNREQGEETHPGKYASDTGRGADAIDAMG